jgi:CBS domain-containing protein
MKSTLITEIMTTELDIVNPAQKLVDVKHIYEKMNFHHHIPVCENDQLVGMVSLIDFMRKVDQAGLDDDAPVYQEMIVKDIMTANPYFLLSSETVEEAAKILAKGQFHALPIVENDKLVGIVSTADVIKFLLK